MRIRQHEQGKSNTECIWETKYHSPWSINNVIGSWRGVGAMTLKEILNDLKEEIKQGK
ncbi:MAG: hypothetical protein WBE34_19890 [Candidatus Nitrosopolaris sp.]|jgi:hypothetical protein